MPRVPDSVPPPPARQMARLPAALLGTVLGALLVGAVPAQDPPPDAARLQALLRELGQLGPKAWAACQQQLEREVRAAEQRAQQLRADAARLQLEAAAADATVQALRGEIARMQAIEQLLRATAPTTAPKAAPPTAPVAPPTPAMPAPAPPASAGTADAQRPPEPAAAAAAGSPALVDWSTVEPLLQDRCSSCHEPSDQKGGLDVTSFAAVRRGGGSGRTLVPGDPDQSRLWRMVAHLEQPAMPKGEDPLPPEQVALLRTWIEQGASETVAAARAFVAARDAAARAPAAAVASAEAGPMPATLPPAPLALPARPGAIKALARSPNAPLVALPGLGQVLLFDPALHPLGVLPLDFPVVEQLAFATDGTLLVAAAGDPGRSGCAVVIDVAAAAVRGAFGAERDVPLGVAVHAAAGLVALGGAGKRVQVLRLGDGAEHFVARHEDFVLALQFSPDGTLLAAADRSGEVRLWETKVGSLAETLTGHRGAVHGLAFTHDGSRLLTAGADGTVRCFEAASGKEIWRQTAHEGQAFAVATTADGRVASCGSDGRIAVHDRAGKAVGKSAAAGEWLYAVAFGADGGTVWAGDWQGRLHRYEVGARGAMPVTTPLRAAQ